MLTLESSAVGVVIALAVASIGTLPLVSVSELSYGVELSYQSDLFYEGGFLLSTWVHEDSSSVCGVYKA